MASSDRIIRTVDVARNTVTFECNGSKVTIAAKELSEEIQVRAMLHGLNQTIGDAAAIETKEIAGKMHRPTCEEKIAAMRGRIETLLEGKWSDSPVRASKIPDVIQAIVNVLGIDEEMARDHYEKLTKDERRELTKEPNVALEIHKIRAARLQIGHGKPEAPRESILSRFKK